MLDFVLLFAVVVLYIAAYVIIKRYSLEFNRPFSACTIVKLVIITATMLVGSALFLMIYSDLMGRSSSCNPANRSFLSFVLYSLPQLFLPG